MPRNIIVDFLTGKLDVIEFKRVYDEDSRINDFLQGIIDGMKTDPSRKPIPYSCEIAKGDVRTFSITVPYLLEPNSYPGRRYGQSRYASVRNCLTYEYGMLTHDPRTAAGALDMYSEVYEIYFQIDQSIPYFYKYSNDFSFAIEVIPEYLQGGQSEIYIQKYILPLYPDTMKKTERKRAAKSKIRETFKSEKGYPCWPQYSEWPMDKEGKPATYIGKGKSEGDLRRFRFRDETDGEIIVIEQAY